MLCQGGWPRPGRWPDGAQERSRWVLTHTDRPVKSPIFCVTRLRRCSRMIAQMSEELVWNQVVARAWCDDDFMKRLLSDPRAVLAEYDLEVPPGTDVEVVMGTEVKIDADTR